MALDVLAAAAAQPVALAASNGANNGSSAPIRVQFMLANAADSNVPASRSGDCRFGRENICKSQGVGCGLDEH